jgi:hypothetical protein
MWKEAVVPQFHVISQNLPRGAEGNLSKPQNICQCPTQDMKQASLSDETEALLCALIHAVYTEVMKCYVKRQEMYI